MIYLLLARRKLCQVIRVEVNSDGVSVNYTELIKTTSAALINVMNENTENGIKLSQPVTIFGIFSAILSHLP